MAFHSNSFHLRRTCKNTFYVCVKKQLIRIQLSRSLLQDRLVFRSLPMMQMNHQHVTSNVCGFFIIKMCAGAGVNPQSHNFRHFITRRSSFVCCFNLWMQENQYSTSTLCSVHHQRFDRKENSCTKPGEISPKVENKKHFRDEIMKNLNRTEHEKRFVENFYGCLRMEILMNIFHPLQIPMKAARELGITSLREYQCRK